MSPFEFYNKEERKVNGVFYTPSFLAEYLARKVVKYFGSRRISTAIDPACGDSILLRLFAKELMSKNILLPKIFGVDKDINAIISSTLKFNDKSFKKFATRFINADGLFPVNGKNSVEGWSDLRKELKAENGFDVAISNPPWGAQLNGYDQLTLNFNFTLAKGQFDIFDLFVEVILQNLIDGGIYGLILPDSVFSQEQARFRCLLSKNTTIHLIARLGEKIFPEINRACVIIVGSKIRPKSNHLVDCFRLSSNFKKRVVLNELALEEVEKKFAHKVPQSRFYKNNNCVFDIDLKIDEQKTFDKIQKNTVILQQIVKNTRGAEISKKGLVCQCPNCKHWMPYPKAKQPKCSSCKTGLNLENIQKEKIILNHNGVGNIKLKVGEDLFRFTSFSKSWINTLKDGINYKHLSIYNGNKILVRKTGVGITASLDYENAVTNQVVYILKLKPAFEKKVSLEFVLSVLNSRAMTYYLIKKYGENEWKSHPYLTQTMLVNLPFPKVDFKSPDVIKLINHVTELVRKEVSHSKEKNISKPTDLFIERVVAHLFRLNQTDYETIFETLNSSEQLIPIKRLMNCNTKEIFSVNGF
ncbi:MAG: Eco57I restriction-modification methylase domain-containing protein [Ginsengibacter sp.]